MLSKAFLLLSLIPLYSESVIRFPGVDAGRGLSVLTDAELYVIDSDVPCIVFASSTSGGAVKISEDGGPMKVRAMFSDGEKFETRTYGGRHIYTVEAEKTGLVELFVVPHGAVDNADVFRRVLDVKAGVGPRPPPLPPGPTPTPDPLPPSPDPVVYTGLRVLVVFDNEKFNPVQRNAFRSAEVRDWLKANTVDNQWRMWEVSQTADLSKEVKPLRDLWESSKSQVDVSRGPQLIIATDQSADVMDFPGGTGLLTTREVIDAVMKVLGQYKK